MDKVYGRWLANVLFTRLALRPLCLLPVRKNRVMFECFHNKQYACNPRYISEELQRLAGDRLEIAWNFRSPEEFEFLKDRGIRVLKNGSWEMLRYALTARVICVNTYYKATMPRRHGQFYLRTWHGGGAYKGVGNMQKQPFLNRVSMRLQQSGANLYISSSRAFTQMTLRDAFGYKGEVLETGMPRNDILVNGADAETVRRIRDALGLRDGEKLVLYAPTYRDDTKPHCFHLDHEKLTDALKARFGGEWKCAYRSHHVTMLSEKGENSENILDVTRYPDMQELLIAADALITDYSSCMWDMSLMFKPVFLYCPDLSDYQTGRDFFTDIHTWPFPLSESNDALSENIRAFDEDDYRQKVRKHHEDLGSYETGHAAHDAAIRIMKECGLDVSGIK